MGLAKSPQFPRSLDVCYAHPVQPSGSPFKLAPHLRQRARSLAEARRAHVLVLKSGVSAAYRLRQAVDGSPAEVSLRYLDCFW